MMIDPIHMNCATCIWWKRQGPQLANAKRDPSCAKDTGTCQVHAPTVVLQGNEPLPVSMFPRTHETRFCGDWQGTGYGGGDDGERIVVPFPPAANRVAA